MQLHKCNCILNVLTVAAKVIFLSVCCGVGALTAGDNLSYFNITVVMISNYYPSGSFHLWVVKYRNNRRY